MNKLHVAALAMLLGLLILVPSSIAQRGGRGGGGRGGGMGGARPGGGMPQGGTVHSYGGGAGPRPSQPIAGPQGGRTSGSITTKGGSTVDYKGAAAGGTGPGGVSGGKAVGGIQVTTPGGREVTKAGKAGGVSGPGGRTVAGKEGVTVGSGPQGSMASKYKGGVAIGPQGGVAAGGRAGVASGPGGTVAGGTRAAVAGGAYGAAAGRTTAAAGRGTYYRSTTMIGRQGIYVRQSVASYPCFRAGWYREHPGAWLAAGWATAAVWRAATWNNCSTYCGIDSEPVSYDYGSNVVYQDDGVYVDGQRTASTEEYAEQATTLADTGREAKASKDDDWLPLGVFAMVQGSEKTSNHIFQLAVSKEGVIRGNYYDAVTDTSSPIYGSVDKKTQRAAWTVGDRKTPVYEAGLANLTKEYTTMIAHYGKERSAQFSLVRIEEPEKKDE